MPKPQAPGLSPGNGLEVIVPKGTLPKTGESANTLLPVGSSIILLAAVLYLVKKGAKV
nr:LPXTG cell wall anchor domain-containing protein [Lactococcus lactis]